MRSPPTLPPPQNLECAPTMDDTELGAQKIQDFEEAQMQFLQDSKDC